MTSFVQVNFRLLPRKIFAEMQPKTTKRITVSIRSSGKALNSSTRGLTCDIDDSMLSRIIVSLAMTAVLFVAQAGFAAPSCILSSPPTQQACKPGSCANKTCCATSNQHKSTPAHPLAKSNSSYEVNAIPVALPVTIPPNLEVASQKFLLSNAAFGAHSPPTLALICIRLI